MQYFGGKLSAAQLQVVGWVGSLRRSLQGALELVWGQEKQEEEEDDKEDEEEESGDEGGRFQRAMSPLRSFASRSRRSLHRFSIRSRKTLQRKATKTCSDQTNSFSTKNEDKDTDALIDFGLKHDQQDPVWEQTSERNSPQPVPDEVPEVSSEDTADDLKEPEFAPFPESSTPLLDTSAQRSKADLGKRRIRSRPSRKLTAGLAQKETQDWRTQDSTAEKETVSKERESDSEEEQPKPKVVCSPSQRVSVFPGMSPAGLLAQIKRKTGGGGTGVKEETVESKASEEKEHRDEEVAPSSVELSRSPRTPARLAGATRVLPLIGNKEEGGASSPAWLKELKSKKRMSQHGSDA